MTSKRRPIGGPAAWHGRELAQSDDWVRGLSPADCAEIDAALRGLEARGLVWPGIGAADFPLPTVGPMLAGIVDDLEHARGVVLLRGLPVERYSEAELRQIFWGLGSHIGTARRQNPAGEMFGEVRDELRAFGNVIGESIQPGDGAPLTSRGRSRTNGPLRFHTDRTDVIALLCVRQARAGGDSKVASSVTVHDRMLARRPDLLELLFQDYYHVPQDQDGNEGQRYYALPVFALCDGHFTSQYTRTAVEAAQAIAEVPRLTAAQDEALDLHAEIAAETCHRFRLAPGDILFMNNHVVYHAREAYEDEDGAGCDRLLLRLWFAVPNSRPLPAGFEVLWGSVEPGAPRGGVVPTAGTAG